MSASPSSSSDTPLSRLEQVHGAIRALDGDELMYFCTNLAAYLDPHIISPALRRKAANELIRSLHSPSLAAANEYTSGPPEPLKMPEPAGRVRETIPNAERKPAAIFTRSASHR